jgi:hypothetical protein
MVQISLDQSNFAINLWTVFYYALIIPDLFLSCDYVGCLEFEVDIGRASFGLLTSM